MNTLDNAKAAAERYESIETPERANNQRTTALMYAAIAQAESLANIARELGRLNDSASLITSLEAEIVLDLHTRRAAERASYAAYHKASAEAEAEPA